MTDLKSGQHGIDCSGLEVHHDYIDFAARRRYCDARDQTPVSPKSNYRRVRPALWSYEDQSLLRDIERCFSALSGRQEPMMKKTLSEADILAAPKASYMSEAQHEFFRQRLLAIRSQLLEIIRNTTQQLRTRDQDRKLKKIDDALQRITAGTYGFCADSGEPIGIARLLGQPTATLSIDAQGKRERRQKQFAG